MRWCLPRILVALGAALCVVSTTAHSQTVGAWTTVDDLTNPDAVATGVSADGRGNLFVAGSIKDAVGITHAVIQQSSNQGELGSWTTSDDLPGARYERIVSKAGVTVAAASQGEACRIRGRIEGVNNGGWSDLMEPSFIHPNPKYTLETIWDVELDVNNNIFVAAEYREKVATGVDKRGNIIYSNLSRPVVLKRLSGSWVTPIEPDPAFSIRKLVTSGTDIYCTGDQWRVRKSIDGGLTWAIVDNFIDSQFGGWDATDIAIDGIGQLFVTGRAIRLVETTSRGRKVLTQYYYWFTRKGVCDENGVWEWQTTDDFRTGTGPYENQATAIAIDKFNNVSVTGHLGNESGKSQWATRQYSPSTGKWTTTDDFYATTYGTRGNRIAADPLTGNVFTTGGAFGISPRWIVRRQLAPVPTLVP